MITFVHAADLHLDSPFRGVSEMDDGVAEVLRNATFASFKDIVRLCIDREVDFLVVAGDVYDGAERSLKAQLAFRDGLARLSDAGIPSFVAHGNHDPLNGWAAHLDWPPLVRVFPAEVATFPVDDKALVHGISFSERDVTGNLAAGFERAGSDLPQIGVLHCNVGTNTGHDAYAPCSVDDLKEAGMDYWALGHVHTRSMVMEAGPVAAYPGNIQGLHINEPGPHGCLHVRIDGSEVSTEFVATDRARWCAKSLDISGLGTEQKLIDAVGQSIAAISDSARGRLALCRLTLAGRGPLHKTLQNAEHFDDLAAHIRKLGCDMTPRVWLCGVQDETKPPVDTSKLREGEDFLGDLLKLSEECRADPELQADLLRALKPLYGHYKLSRYIKTPDSRHLLELIEKAESLCVDGLLGA